jgi:demethylmenaquinone methyltransferase/2-methoxy-6-polyprenyl-1,4-benzoquinol methylase
MDPLADYYARRAAEYERIYAKPERQADLRRLRARIGDMFDKRTVLELACGTGYWTQIIAGRAARVSAFDLNEEMLEVARAKDIAPGKASFRIGNAFEKIDGAGDCDALFAGFWWSHVPLERLDAFLHTATGAMAPGALIAFLDNRYVEGSSTPVSRRDAQGNAYQLRELDDGSRHEVLKNFPGEGELIRCASKYGWGAHVELFEYYWLLSWWAP